MSDELATPEHDKLLAEPELEAQLDRLFEWMASRGRSVKVNNGKGLGTTRIAVCELRPEHISEKMKCPDCHGSGKQIKKLTQRQQQVVKHMELLKKEERPWQVKEKAAHEKALAELEMWLGELDECDNCYGKGEATVYRQGDPVWQPVFTKPRELMLEMLGIDRKAFKDETAELFAQLRKQADRRPVAASDEMTAAQKARADGDGIDPH